MTRFRDWFGCGLVGCALLLAHDFSQSDEVLPHGDAPPALVSPYFPDRVHEFVWRNWNVVEPERIAKLLGATEQEVNAMAESMGLPSVATIPPEMRTRGYATIIRRNWHLLPYEQLLELIDMTPERLAFMLREEDFLWVKLGRHKPACEPLRYQPPDETARRRAAEIHRLVKQDFGDLLQKTGEPRFDFVRQLTTLPDNPTLAKAVSAEGQQRLVYSYVAVYGDPLLNPQLNPYPDGLLQRLSEVGIHGVWLQAVLRDLAPGGEIFPEFGVDHEQRLANLGQLVQRAKKFGVNVYLYINEPRAMPTAFFQNRPDLAGVAEGELTTLCTSQPAVRQWMGDALAHIFREVPDLGGVYAITASENLTNCASHGAWRSCPHCKNRSEGDILVEVNRVIEEGVHRGNPKAEVLISDWGWRGHGEASDIIAQLPKSVCLMSVSEWSLPIERGGVPSVVGEYSISSVGPGPRAQQHWKAAHAAGLTAGTEIQFNNTCEIATVPYLPVLDLVGEHCRNLAPANLHAMLIGWTMGGHPSPNFRLAQVMSRRPTPDLNDALNTVALERFGPAGAPLARQAWASMSEAYRQYPFHISVVYTSPVQWGPANPLYAATTGYSATMWGIPYDDLNGWRGPYPGEVLAAQFEKVAQGWQPGLQQLRQAAERAPPEFQAAAQADVRYAQAAAIHFQAVANQCRFVLARDALADPGAKLSPEHRTQLRRQMQESITSEMELARELYTLVQADSRIGFEPSCQYFYLPLDLVEKTINCRWLLEHFALEEDSTPSP